MKLGIILGATREGRHSDKVANWVLAEASKMEGVQAELLDLRDYPMPFFEEAVSPQFNPARTPSAAVKKWLDKLAEFEAYVVVTPEYSHSIPAVLKNAFDMTDFQFKRKPFGIVSHGTVGGARAAEHLKAIVFRCLGFVVPAAVALTMRPSEVFDENGTLSEEVAAQPYGPLAALKATLAELQWFSDALSGAQK